MLENMSVPLRVSGSFRRAGPLAWSSGSNISVSSEAMESILHRFEGDCTFKCFVSNNLFLVLIFN